MIFTDGVHLVSDGTLTDLHLFASELGLKREWFQDGRLPHYDLTTARAARRAEALGARPVSTREVVKAIRGGLARGNYPLKSWIASGRMGP
jgi:hypothetical protein